MSAVDQVVWIFCGLGLILALTAVVAFWSAARVAGEDDRRLERTRRRLKEDEHRDV